MAIDYGKARIGLAVTDPMQIIASPLETIPTATIFTFLKSYLQKEQVEKFVVGIPLRFDGTAPAIVKDIEIFTKKLEKTFPQIPIFMVDESFTSSEAAKGLFETGVSKKIRKQKGVLDKVSASLILQRFLEENNS